MPKAFNVESRSAELEKIQERTASLSKRASKIAAELKGRKGVTRLVNAAVTIKDALSKAESVRIP